MKSSRCYCVNVVATGFVVLILLSLPLFWGRLICETSLRTRMPRGGNYLSIKPSGLVPSAIERDPNTAIQSHISAGMYSKGAGFDFLGIDDYVFTRALKDLKTIHYYNTYGGGDFSFDLKTGNFSKRVRRDTTVDLYAGPEGISQTQDKSLGRFIEPIIDDIYEDVMIVYDKKLRRFFKIDFSKKTVVKGPELTENDKYNPVQIGRLSKARYLHRTEWSDSLYLNWSPPNQEVLKRPKKNSSYTGGPSKYEYKPLVKRNYLRRAGPYLLVLDETGRIDLLDKQSLEFAGIAGHLLAAETYFGSSDDVGPKDLLSYEVEPVAFDSNDQYSEEFYRGICVAGVCREGTAITLGVFDKTGKLIKIKHSLITYITEYKDDRRKPTPSSKAVYWAVAWAPFNTMLKYSLENLQPPILSVVSYLTADCFDASSGYRALFILSNSFAAMKGRAVEGNDFALFIEMLLLILPSLLFSIWLSVKVTKNAKVVGLSENAKTCWLIGTICFGLSAYITYRLTRPKITLVTCENCGKPRRPDMTNCHRCNSRWHIPELLAPDWRVLNGKTEQPPKPTEESDTEQ